MSFPPKDGYDPNPKKRRRNLVKWLVFILGLGLIEELPLELRSALTWQTAQDVIRELQTGVIQEALPEVKYKDWITEPGACDLCLYYAASGPYEISVAGPDTHPNCRCSWQPHVD